MENKAYIEIYLEEMSSIVENISREDIDLAIEAIYGAWQRGRTVFTMGNGGSASTATHLACDLAKTTVVEGKPRLKSIALTDNVPLVSALTNDDGFDNVFIEQLKSLFGEGDVVIGVSVHGGSGRDRAGLWSQNLLKAMAYSRENGGLAIGLSGFDGGAMKELADICVVVPFDSTPQVESFHVAVGHLIAGCLRRRIESDEASDLPGQGRSRQRADLSS